MVSLSITFHLPATAKASAYDELLQSCAQAKFMATKQQRYVTALKVWYRVWYAPPIEEELEKVCQPRGRFREWLRVVEVNSGIDFHGLDTRISAPAQGFHIRERTAYSSRALQMVLHEHNTAADRIGLGYAAIHSFQSAVRSFISLAAICHIARQAVHLDGQVEQGTIQGMKKKLARIEQLCEGNYDPHVAGSTALTPQPSR